MDKMKIVEYDIDDLISAEYNPRQMTSAQERALTDSIKRFGLVDPIIINTNPDRRNIIIGGHQRVRIAKSMGLKKIPCVELDLTVEKEKELNVRLNKNTGEWDYEVLQKNFAVGKLMEWGFNDEELYLLEDDSYGEEFSLPSEDREPFQQMVFFLADDQAEMVKNAVAKAKKLKIKNTGNENHSGNALWWICKQYYEQS